MRAKQCYAVIFASFLINSIVTLAQRTPPPPSVTTLPMPNPTRPGSIQDSGTYGYWTYISNQDRAGGALLGKVAIDDEMLPWEPILVTVSCKGATVYTTQTDPKGNFAIIPGKVPGALSTLPDRQRQMQAQYEGCFVQPFLTGFHSNAITVTQRNLRDEPEVGTITLVRDASARGTAMSATNKSAPEEAVKHWNQAGAELLQQTPNLSHARRELEKAVRSYPSFADAWYQLGRLQLLSSPRDARTCFQKAAAADPNFVLPYEQLAALAVGDEDWHSVLDNTARSLQLDPLGSMRTWYYSALANFQLGNVDEAETSALRALNMDPLHNIRNEEQLLAAILARKADFAGALAHLRNCLAYITEGPDASLLKEQIAQLEHRLAPSN
jgi:hypothetical protein